MLSLFVKQSPVVPQTKVTATKKQAAIDIIRRPTLESKKMETRPVDAKADAYLEEYAELAALIGVGTPDLEVEKFKHLLSVLNLPVYSLAEVVKYMDEKAAKESEEKAGWEWRPLREKDNLDNVRIGNVAERYWGSSSRPTITKPASDYYVGPTWREHPRNGWRDPGEKESTPQEVIAAGGKIASNLNHMWRTEPSSKPYDRTVPLHAIRRVALIEKNYNGRVGFFVSDYALAPTIQYPDPFLMVIVPNANVNRGVGRFIIDFWDEPGFGIEQMLK